MHLSIFLPILLLGTLALPAQQVAGTAASSIQREASAPTLPTDPAKLSELIGGSYYHPDGLSRLDCWVSIDWVAFSKSGKLNFPDDRLKVLQGLKVHSHAVRGKIPELTFDWSLGELDTKERMESGLKQVIGGFYQMYWSMLSTNEFTSGSDIKKIEPLPDGSAKVDLSGGGASLVITVNKDGSPTHWELDSPAMKGTIDPEYTASPRPVPGDVRRVSRVKVVQQIGTSNMNVDLGLDYQEVGGFFVPKNVSFGIVGAYTVPMEFSGCAATSTASTH